MRDSVAHAPLDLANVAMVNPKDTSLYSHTLANKDGAFTLRNLPTDVLSKIVISFTGFENYRHLCTLNRGELREPGSVFLEPVMMSDVVVNR